MRTRPARFDFADPVPSVADLGSVHLIAVGGAGMSAVARLLLDLGVPVSGSDAADSPILRSLAARGADVHVGHDPAYLEGAQTVVVSSAIRETNPELAEARRRGLRVLHRAQALAAVAGDRVVVAVAGANGKTTTTSMLVTALRHCGLNPSFAVGGELIGLDTNAMVGTGAAFVLEADESDGSFLVYRPQVAVVTSVQPDHLDFFGTIEAVEAAYRDFTDTVRPGGVLVACVDDPGARQLATSASGRGLRVVGYGTAPDADVRIGATAYEGLGSTSRLHDGGAERQLRLRVPGAHNVLDAAGAYAAAVHGLGAPAAAALEGLGAFAGARRRFEPVGSHGGVEVVDDYAHNPAKVAAAVATARALVRAGGRLVVVFQPHLYTRTRDFAAEFGSSLSGADVVVVTDVYAAREDPIPGVTGALVAAAVRAVRPEADVRFEPSLAGAAALVGRLALPGDLVLTVGAGDVTSVGPELLRRLEGRGGC